MRRGNGATGCGCFLVVVVVVGVFVFGVRLVGWRVPVRRFVRRYDRGLDRVRDDCTLSKLCWGRIFPRSTSHRGRGGRNEGWSGRMSPPRVVVYRDGRVDVGWVVR